MTFLRVMTFSVAVLLGFTLFANILPQVQSDPPADDEGPSGTLDLAGLVTYGEKLFSGKGNCTLCHNDLGRAPDLLKLDLAKTFSDRLGDPGYAGKAKAETGAKAVEAYLRESMLEPSAYVVSGFGKKGTADKVSPMPQANAAPAELSEVQITALIAFLQNEAGLEPSVAIPDVAGAGETSAASTGNTADEDDDEDGPATTATAALEKFACSACHDLEGSEADAGPKLHGIAARMSRDKIVQAIVDPNAEVAEGYEPDTMPAGFGEQMLVSELDLIVDYLLELKN